VTSERPTLRFSELFESVTSRSEVVVTFLALLELIRLKHLTAIQREAFGEIEVCRVGPPPPAASDPRAHTEAQAAAVVASALEAERGSPPNPASPGTSS
jgi:hypothetical protein